MKKSPFIFGVSAGAIASGLIVAAKFYQWPHQELLIPAIPTLIGTLVTVLNYLAIYLQLDTQAERVLKKRIKYLENTLNGVHLTAQAKLGFQKQLEDAHQALLNINTTVFKSVK